MCCSYYKVPPSRAAMFQPLLPLATTTYTSYLHIGPKTRGPSGDGEEHTVWSFSIFTVKYQGDWIGERRESFFCSCTDVDEGALKIKRRHYCFCGVMVLMCFCFHVSAYWSMLVYDSSTEILAGLPPGCNGVLEIRKRSYISVQRSWRHSWKRTRRLLA